MPTAGPGTLLSEGGQEATRRKSAEEGVAPHDRLDMLLGQERWDREAAEVHTCSSLVVSVSSGETA